METRANFVLIGVLLVSAVLAFGAFTLWMGQSQFNRDFDRYDIVFDGPIVLEQGAVVRFNGISVGEVERVAIDREDDARVRTRVRVDSNTPVRTDSHAQIDFAGITGATFVQIKAGSQNAPLVERRPGDPIPEIQADPTPLAELFSGSADVLKTAAESADRFNRTLSDENLESVSGVLANLDSFTQALSRDDRLVEEANDTLASIRQATEAVVDAGRTYEKLGRTLDGQVIEIAGDARAMISELRSAIAKANDTMDQANLALTGANDLVLGPGTTTVEELGLASQDLRRLITRLDGLVREIEQNPEVFVVGDPAPYEGDR